MVVVVSSYDFSFDAWGQYGDHTHRAIEKKQGCLACCSPGVSHRVGHDWATELQKTYRSWWSDGVTVSRPQIKTLKALHCTQTCWSPSVAESPDAERVCRCWTSWPMPVWAALCLLCGQPDPGQYAATTARWPVEVCFFASWEDDNRTERASHDECGQSSCRRGDMPRNICRVWNTASKSSAASSQRWTADSPSCSKARCSFLLPRTSLWRVLRLWIQLVAGSHVL